MCACVCNSKLIFLFRKSNPQIQKWMAMQNYTDYSQLEQYYETRCVALDFIQVLILLLFG